jgi:hypothetical protein
MTNLQRGFTAPLLLALIAILILAGGAYVYAQNKQGNQPTSAQTSTAGSFITISSPKSEDILTAGQTYKITWTSENVAGSVDIQLFSSNTSSISSPVAFLANEVPNNGSYSWVVDPKTPRGSYSILIIDSNSTGPGQTEVFGQSGTFSIISTVPAPVTPSVKSISPDTAYVDKTKFGFGNRVTVYGTGFTNSYSGSYKIHLLNASTGTEATDVSADNSSGVPTNDTQFSFSVPNNMSPGLYEIVIENSSYSLKSQPYPFTVASSNI